MKFKLCALCCVLATASVFATPIGILGIGSSGVVDETLTSILFTADPSAIGLCPGAACNGDVNAGTNLTFAGGPLNLLEGILINNGQPFGLPPPPGAGLFNPFFRFALHPNLLFTLTGIDPGSSNSDCVAASAGVGGSCSIDVAGSPSPIVLTKVGTSTLISIGLLGEATDGVRTSNWTGAFSATIPSITPEGILLHFCPSGTCTAADLAAGRTLKVLSTSGSFQAISDISEPEPLMITTTSAANGVVGASYSQTITATGGTPPYLWSIIRGRLPAGLAFNSLTGQITGTPTNAEIVSVTFQVSDSSNPAQIATVTLTFTITAN